MLFLTTEDYVTVGALRKVGYRKAMQNAGLEVDEDYVFKINDTKNLYSQIEKIFHLEKVPDAILAVNEIYAAIAMKLAIEKGYKIPQDIAVLGFTSGLISQFTSPPLTAITQHGYLMGQQAAELLINRIEHIGPKEFQKEVISTGIKIRKSTYIGD